MALESSGYAYVDGFSNGLIPTFNPREYHRRPIHLDERFRDHYELVNPFFRLYKMHGSINWTIYDGNVVELQVSRHHRPVPRRQTTYRPDDFQIRLDPGLPL